MRQHLAAVTAALALIFAALFTIKVAQGQVMPAVISGIAAFPLRHVRLRLVLREGALVTPEEKAVIDAVIEWR
jgi:hypothetical protein